MKSEWRVTAGFQAKANGQPNRSNQNPCGLISRFGFEQRLPLPRQPRWPFIQRMNGSHIDNQEENTTCTRETNRCRKGAQSHLVKRQFEGNACRPSHLTCQASNFEVEQRKGRYSRASSDSRSNRRNASPMEPE